MFNEKKLVYALRHNPEQFGLKPDLEGYVNIQDFLNAMGITREELENIILKMNKKRLEIKGDKIRAAYGHSFNDKINHKESVPPEFLYHGTSPFSSYIIKKEGLSPMKRQYVHLSSTKETAFLVGKRKHKDPVILLVKAKDANDSGVKFYHSNEDIWLSERIPAKYIN